MSIRVVSGLDKKGGAVPHCSSEGEQPPDNLLYRYSSADTFFTIHFEAQNIYATGYCLMLFVFKIPFKAEVTCGLAARGFESANFLSPDIIDLDLMFQMRRQLHIDAKSMPGGIGIGC